MAEELTIEAIDKLEMGKETDVLVAEMMGFSVHRFDFEYDGITKACMTWHKDGESFNPVAYSKDISPAMQVVEKLNSLGYKFLMVLDTDGDVEQIRLMQGDDNCPHQKPYDPKDGHGYTEIDVDPIDSIKAPLGICRVAIKAKLQEGTK